ncbi:MAG: DUF4190 domain-containing protein [Gemmataceae bacterium]
MAEVRVNCPTCKAELAIGEEHLGQEVECGSCLGVFVAQESKSSKKPDKGRRNERDHDDADDDRPRRKRRRRRDDEDDFDYSPPGAGGGDGGGTGLAVTSLIFGIVSFPLLCCCHLNVPASLMGIVFGAIAIYKPNGRGLAITGLVLSILSLVIYGGLFAFGLGLQGLNAGKDFR